MSLEEIEIIQEIVTKVYEVVKNRNLRLDLMGQGDWLDLLESISEEGYEWSYSIMVRCAVLLSGDCDSNFLSY